MEQATIISEEAQILASLNAAFASVTSREDIIAVLVKHLKPVFRFDAAIIGMVEPDGKRMRLFAHVFLPEMLQSDFFQRFFRKTIHLENTPFEVLLTFREPFLTTPEFVAEYYDFRPFKMLSRIAGVRHVMAAPLWCGGEAVGVMNLASKQENHFQARDVALFKALTEQAALAVRAVFAKEKLRSTEKEILLQRRLHQSFQAAASEDNFVVGVAESLASEIPCSFCEITTFSRENVIAQRFTFQRTETGIWEKTTVPQPKQISASEEAYSGAPEICIGEEFTAECSRNKHVRALQEYCGVESVLLVRFALPKEQFGIITLGERQPYGFSEQDWEILDRCAPQIALGWVSLQARIELELYKHHSALNSAIEEASGESGESNRKHGLEAAIRSKIRQALPQKQILPDVVGISSAITEVAHAVKQVAPTTATVLLEGETGTGKERIARAVHALSPRSGKPFVAVNCAALPANLIESELFGHEKGAFTGAKERRIGKFELAQGGTIFLDEIGEMPLDAQAKLLRAVQERELERVGGKEIIQLDVRVIAATNRSLAEESAKGRFRADLYYRLNVFPITIPPLRERKDDIPLLVEHFLQRVEERLGKTFLAIEDRSMQALMEHSWQGNIRELENMIERAAILSKPPLLKIAGIILPLRQSESKIGSDTPDNLGNPSAEQARQKNVATLEEAERQHILRALAQTNWRVSGEKGAAALLEMKPTTLEYRMKKLGIQRKKA
jgi:transcriptional regulator with GAF, ATPase, and Fis domain